MKKKMTILLLAAAMVLPFAGCGNDQQTDSNTVTPQVTAEVTETAAAETTEEAAADQTAAQAETQVALDTASAIDEGVRLYGADNRTSYVSEEGTLYATCEDGPLFALAQQVSVAGTKPVQVYNKGSHMYILGEDGKIYGSDRQYFPDYHISYMCADVMDNAATRQNIFGVTDDGQVFMQGIDDDNLYSMGVSDVRYVYSRDNSHLFLLFNNGTVSYMDPSALGGYDRDASVDFSPCDVSAWTDIQWLAVGAANDGSGFGYVVGLKSDGTLACTGAYPLGIEGWTDVVYIGTYDDGIYGITADGQVLLSGSDPDAVGAYAGVRALYVGAAGQSVGICNESSGYGNIGNMQVKYVPGAGGTEDASFETIDTDPSYVGSPGGAGYNPVEAVVTEASAEAVTEDPAAADASSTEEYYDDSYQSEESQEEYYDDSDGNGAWENVPYYDDESDSGSGDSSSEDSGSYYYDPFAPGNAIGKVID